MILMDAVVNVALTFIIGLFILLVLVVVIGFLFVRGRQKRGEDQRIKFQYTLAPGEFNRFAEEGEPDDEHEGKPPVQMKGPFGLTYDVRENGDPRSKI